MSSLRRSCMVLTCCVLFGAPVPAGAVAVFADKLVVKNRGTSASRKIVATAGPRDLGIFIYGSPDYPGGGATLTIIANGANPTMQTFSLPQGTGTNGKPFWRFVAAGGGGGYLYEDPRGEQGPVTTALVKSTANLSGTYRDTIKVVLRGKNGQIDVVPPNPGTDAFVTLEIWSGPIYCLKYGADGVVSNAGDRTFRVTHPQTSGCPPTTTTTTTTTTSTTLYGMPSAAFLDPPADLIR